MATTFADRLNELMSEYHLSKYALCQRTGFKYSTVVQYCAGTRSPSNPRKEELAKLFNCDVDYLMGRSDVRRVQDLEVIVDDRVSSKDIEVLSALKQAEPNVRAAIMILLGLKVVR